MLANLSSPGRTEAPQYPSVARAPPSSVQYNRNPFPLSSASSNPLETSQFNSSSPTTSRIESIASQAIREKQQEATNGTSQSPLGSSANVPERSTQGEFTVNYLGDGRIRENSATPAVSSSTYHVLPITPNFVNHQKAIVTKHDMFKTEPSNMCEQSGRSTSSHVSNREEVPHLRKDEIPAIRLSSPSCVDSGSPILHIAKIPFSVSTTNKTQRVERVIPSSPINHQMSPSAMSDTAFSRPSGTSRVKRAKKHRNLVTVTKRSGSSSSPISI